MGRVLTAVCGGLLLGVLATLAAVRMGQSSNASPDDIVRDIENIPQMAEAVAEKLRDEHYVSLVNIEQVLALPTEFARSEALYLLAGRSSAAEVQSLIFEANRIADNVERESLLNILFFQLAELDPKSALALAKTDHFKSLRSIERKVWRAWGRQDLDEALFAAKTQTTSMHQDKAAQSLYAAFGYMGNETTDRIEAELGIGPNRSSRAGYLYRLADSSPTEAIAFINGHERGDEQKEYVNWLAYYVLGIDPTGALQYASLFEIAADSELYNSIIESRMAKTDPRRTIDRILASGIDVNRSKEFRSAARTLTSTDLDAAIQYYEQEQSADKRRYLGELIAAEMAKSNPLEAMAWARANDSHDNPSLQRSALYKIAQTDPQLALAEALKTPNLRTRSKMVSNIIHQVGRSDPTDAVAYLDQIPDQQQRLEASKKLAQEWMKHDAKAAVDWILSEDEGTAAQILQKTSHHLVRNDLDAAIQFLPRLDRSTQSQMRRQIVEALARTRSPQEAQSFIQQFEGERHYAQLQASIISIVGNTDIFMARQLADQIADENARDAAYARIISQHAETDPADAMLWLDSIGNDESRESVAGQLAVQWVNSDPFAATRWAANLPSGPTKDDAILNMSTSWREMTAEKDALVVSMQDPVKRGRVTIRQIHHYLQTDPAKARRILADADIPSHQRKRIESMMDQERM